MYDPGVVLMRDIWKYHVLWLGLAWQCGTIWLEPRRRLGGQLDLQEHSPQATRPPSDATYFVPIYFWGIAAVLHVHWALIGGVATCFGGSVWAFADHGALSAALLAGVLPACFLTEHRARRRGLATRAAQATVPVAVLAAILGVAMCWTAGFLCSLPIFR